jgi:hypothetical protein
MAFKSNDLVGFGLALISFIVSIIIITLISYCCSSTKRALDRARVYMHRRTAVEPTLRHTVSMVTVGSSFSSMREAAQPANEALFYVPARLDANTKRFSSMASLDLTSLPTTIPNSVVLDHHVIDIEHTASPSNKPISTRSPSNPKNPTAGASRSVVRSIQQVNKISVTTAPERPAGVPPSARSSIVSVTSVSSDIEVDDSSRINMKPSGSKKTANPILQVNSRQGSLNNITTNPVAAHTSSVSSGSAPRPKLVLLKATRTVEVIPEVDDSEQPDPTRLGHKRPVRSPSMNTIDLD